MKTLVVKIGTSTLVRGAEVNEAYIADLARQVVVARDEGWRTAIVSSGAVRIGLNIMGCSRARTVAEKQAAAAIGQSLLMRAYRRAFQSYEIPVAQLLLTRADLSDRRRFLNARHTFLQLSQWGALPIVNENDTVATEELRFGDNDTLAARAALAAEANRVLLLSDVDGFYLPGESRPVERIESITPEVEAAAGGAGSVGGTGGMRTKIEAAEIATHSGIELVIAHGRAPDVVTRVARGEALGTLFQSQRAMRGRKRWIAFGSHVEGTLIVHPKARHAVLEKGSSLLPVGLREVEGEFRPGALVQVRDEAGEYARGLSNFGSDELRRIAGLHTSQVAQVLGGEPPKEIIHRDNLTLVSGTQNASIQQELSGPKNLEP